MIRSLVDTGFGAEVADDRVKLIGTIKSLKAELEHAKGTIRVQRTALEDAQQNSNRALQVQQAEFAQRNDQLQAMIQSLRTELEMSVSVRAQAEQALRANYENELIQLRTMISELRVRLESNSKENSITN